MVSMKHLLGGRSLSARYVFTCTKVQEVHSIITSGLIMGTVRLEDYVT